MLKGLTVKHWVGGVLILILSFTITLWLTEPEIPQLSRRATINLAIMPHQIGAVVDGAAIARAPADRAAYLLYGPYISLPAGSYAVDIAFVCTDNAAANVFDATAQAGKQVLAVARLEPGDPRCNGSNQTVTLPFVLKRATDAVEFRTLFGGQGMLKVTSLVLWREQ